MGKDLIDPKIEQFTRESIFKDLAKGNPLWDIPHTTAVVHHLKQIITYSSQLDSIDPTVLLIAAYGHDWGYSNYYKPNEVLTKEDYMEAKKLHAVIASEKMKSLLESSIYSSLSSKQKERILHLISVHDNISDLTNNDEVLLMEADTLGGLDTDFITSTWTKEQTLKHIEDAKKKRLPKFITDYGKREFEICSQKRINALTS